MLLLLLLLLEQQTGGASPGWPPPGRSRAGSPTHASQSTRRPRALLVVGRALWRGGLLVQQAGELCMQVQIIEPREQRERQAATAAANRARPRPRTRGTPADLRLRSTDPLAVRIATASRARRREPHRNWIGAYGGWVWAARPNGAQDGEHTRSRRLSEHWEEG